MATDIAVSEASRAVCRAHCATCGWETRPMTGTQWNLPEEQAGAATGAHLKDHPDHDVRVVQIDTDSYPRAIDHGHE